MSISAAIRCGCKRDNDPWRKFCGGCGAALGVGCTTCDFRNHADDRFCGGCGAVCSRTTPRARPPQAPTKPGHASTIPIDIGDIVTSLPAKAR